MRIKRNPNRNLPPRLKLKPKPKTTKVNVKLPRHQVSPSRMMMRPVRVQRKKKKKANLISKKA